MKPLRILLPTNDLSSKPKYNYKRSFRNCSECLKLDSGQTLGSTS